MAHDYSIVVQAEKSPVTIRRITNSSAESEHFPTYKLSANVVNIDGSTDGGDGDNDGDNDGDDNDDDVTPASWPSVIYTADQTFNHEFQFAEGNNFVWSSAKVISSDTARHEVKIQLDGVESFYTFDV